MSVGTINSLGWWFSLFTVLFTVSLAIEKILKSSRWVRLLTMFAAITSMVAFIFSTISSSKLTATVQSMQQPVAFTAHATLEVKGAPFRPRKTHEGVPSPSTCGKLEAFE